MNITDPIRQHAQSTPNAPAIVRTTGRVVTYAELDRTGFWRPHVAGIARSQMNIPWRAPSEELEAKFVKESEAGGFRGLKGHRSVGGIRASMYNALPQESVDALVSFMRDFEQKNG